MQLRKVAMNPWDFTLYSTEDGSHVLKVIFSEGEYKMDIGRYFLIDVAPDIADTDLDTLKLLANEIRNAYPEVRYREIKKADLTIAK
jgi:hypothetical protein